MHTPNVQNRNSCLFRTCSTIREIRLGGEKFSGYECDIFLKDFRIGIELDGVYWHRQKKKKDHKKTAAFEAKGILLFRMREEGLSLLSERDISYKSSEEEYLVISRLIESLLRHAQLPDTQCSKLNDYLDGKKLVNEKLYREIVANLPGTSTW